MASLSRLLAGLMALMACGHYGAPLWLASELCAVLCLLYIWAYLLTQNPTAGGVVPVEALVFSFPLAVVAAPSPVCSSWSLTWHARLPPLGSASPSTCVAASGKPQVEHKN